jgi:hypothetical protein
VKTTNPTASKGAENPFTIGDGATVHGYSDAHAYTVVAVTRTTITLRRDKATLLNGPDSGEPDALKVTPGGFCCHTDGRQRYAYEADPNGHLVVARLRKAPRKCWEPKNDGSGEYHHVHRADFRTAGGARVTEGRGEHYDFNF